MIPILYESTETQFVSNGLGRLRDATRVECTEERNGIYEVEFDYPVDGAHFDEIICGRIIAVEHDETNDVQPFDIYAYEKPIDGIVTFHAAHISYRLNKMVLRGGAGATGIQNAIALLSNSVPTNPFTFETDIVNTTSYMSATATVPIPVRSVLGGVEGSFLDAFGGEYEWDKWTVRLWQRRGTEKALTVRYGVNMTDYTDETDFSGAYTKAIAYWSGNVNGKDVIVRSDTVSSGLQPYDGHDACAVLDFSDKYENKPTKAQLNSAAKKYMISNGANLPAQTISVNFVRLTDTDEYKRFAPLQRCKLCDTVQVEFPRYGMSGQFKIVKTVYDVLQERYLELELGDLSMSLSEALGITESSEKSSNLELQNILIGEETTAFTVSVGASTYADVTHDYTKDGYYPIGIVGWSLTGTGATSCYITRCFLSAKTSGSCTLTARIRNATSTAASPNMVITILWSKIID